MKKLLAASVIAFVSGPVVAETVHWVDWTSSTSNTADGVITIGTETIDVSFTNSVNNAFVQTDGGINYWTNPDTYAGSSLVDNAPATSDIIALNAGGTRTIELSETVDSIYFAFVSWNGNEGVFSTTVELLSSGVGYWGSGIVVQTADNTIEGVGEIHGTLLLSGPLNTFFFDSDTEGWHGFTIGVGSVVDDEEPDQPGVIPLPAGFPLLLAGIGALGLMRRKRR